MSREFMTQLAARHERDADALIETWCERAAIREYLAGFSRRAAETWAIGDVESMFSIGLHCPHTRQQMLSGGDRSRPNESRQTAGARHRGLSAAESDHHDRR